MKLIYLLTVFIYFENGAAKDGNQVDGWAPTAFPKHVDCLAAKKKVEAVAPPAGIKNLVWACRSAPLDWNKR